MEEKVINEISRRTLLKWFAGIAGVGIGLPIIGETERFVRHKITFKDPPRLPDDIFPEEALKQMGITIYPSEKVRLQLRTGILDSPLFKGLLEGNYDGVVITLVDEPSMSWKAIGSMPEEPRTVAEAFNDHPQHRSDDWWNEQIRKVDNEIDKVGREYARLTDLKAQYTNKLEERPKALSKYLDEETKSLEEMRERNDPNLARIIRIQERHIEEVKQKLLNWPESKEAFDIRKKIEEIDEKFSLVNLLKEKLDSERKGWDNRAAKAEELAVREDKDGKFSGILAETWNYERYGDKLKVPQSVETLFTKHPEWRRKVYIFLCVGDKFKPFPEQSFISPDRASVPYDLPYQRRDENSTDYKDAPLTIAHTIRHEIGHYSEKGVIFNEAYADTVATSALAEAWFHYSQTGNTRGYPFVFITEEGTTITRRRFLDPRTMLKSITKGGTNKS